MAALGVALLVVPTALSSTAAAAPTEVAFGPTGAEQTFTVPTGVTSIDVTLVGGHGANPWFGRGAGGTAAQVTATLTVNPGDTLYVEVGGNGNGNSGGFNGGGSGVFYGGGGGGATDLRTVSCAGNCAGSASLAKSLPKPD